MADELTDQIPPQSKYQFCCFERTEVNFIFDPRKMIKTVQREKKYQN